MTVTQSDIIKAIKDEPELPGKLMPVTKKEIERVGLEKALQILVQLTKDNITNRVNALYKEKELLWSVINVNQKEF